MTDTLALVTDLQAGFFVARQRSIPCSASAVLSALKFVLNCVYVGGSARSLPCTSLVVSRGHRVYSTESIPATEWRSEPVLRLLFNFLSFLLVHT